MAEIQRSNTKRCQKMHRKLLDQILAETKSENTTNVTTIELNGYSIMALDTNTFQNLPLLTRLSLRQNDVQNFRNDLFKGLANLVELDLSDNKIAGVRSGLFRSLTSLKCLNLSRNRIRNIESLAFQGLANLEYLLLSSNRIEDISSNSFSVFRLLKELDLSDNRIGRIRPQLFKSLFEHCAATLVCIKVDNNSESFRSYWTECQLGLTRPPELIYSNNVADFMKQFNRPDDRKSSDANEQRRKRVKLVDDRLSIVPKEDNKLSAVAAQDVTSKNELIEKLMKDPLIGKLLNNGRYEMKARLKPNSYGFIYLAVDRHQLINNSRAIFVASLPILGALTDGTIQFLNKLVHFEFYSLVKYWEYFEEAGHLFIVMDHYEPGTIELQILNGMQSKASFTDGVLFNWTNQLVDALEYLHIMGVVHGQVKPSNVYLAPNGQVKLGGLECLLFERFAHRLDSVPYMSPEMIDFNLRSTSGDIWSLGCVLYELMFFKVFYLTNRELACQEIDCNYCTFTVLLKRILVDDFEQRATLDETRKILNLGSTCKQY